MKHNKHSADATVAADNDATPAVVGKRSSSHQRYAGVAVQRKKDASSTATVAQAQESRAASTDSLAWPDMGSAPVMRKANGAAAEMSDEATQAAAGEGVQGAGQALPHLDQIQESFGSHDLSSIDAHIGGPAAVAGQAIGAQAYATGSSVAFNEAPDLHTAAHEAAHVVQQRAGVQLKGGVGQVGDAYEQHADAVADAVVAGESARQLLPDGPTSSGKASVQRTPQATPGPVTETSQETPAAKPYVRNPELETQITLIRGGYKWQCELQALVVGRLKGESEKQDPPPLWKTLLIAGAEIAMAGALGGIGKMIEMGIAGSRKGAAQVIAKVIASSATAFGKQSVKATASALAGGKASSTQAFWYGQQEALILTGKHQETEFVKSEESLRNSPDGLAQATALRKAQLTAFNSVSTTQTMHSLDEWCNYLQHAESREDGGVLENHLGDTSRKGVLGMVVDVGQPGTKPTIERAEIEGLNKQLRAKIESRKLKDIHIWKNVDADLDGADFDFAVGPHGAQPKFKSISAKAGEWLNKRARLGGEYGPLEGAKLLVDKDMAEFTVSGKLSG